MIHATHRFGLRSQHRPPPQHGSLAVHAHATPHHDLDATAAEVGIFGDVVTFPPSQGDAFEWRIQAVNHGRVQVVDPYEQQQQQQQLEAENELDEGSRRLSDWLWSRRTHAVPPPKHAALDDRSERGAGVDVPSDDFDADCLDDLGQQHTGQSLHLAGLASDTHDGASTQSVSAWHGASRTAAGLDNAIHNVVKAQPSPAGQQVQQLPATPPSQPSTLGHSPSWPPSATQQPPATPAHQRSLASHTPDTGWPASESPTTPAPPAAARNRRPSSKLRPSTSAPSSALVVDHIWPPATLPSSSQQEASAFQPTVPETGHWDTGGDAALRALAQPPASSADEPVNRWDVGLGAGQEDAASAHSVAAAPVNAPPTVSRGATTPSTFSSAAASTATGTPPDMAVGPCAAPPGCVPPVNRPAGVTDIEALQHGAGAGGKASAAALRTASVTGPASAAGARTAATAPPAISAASAGTAASPATAAAHLGPSALQSPGTAVPVIRTAQRKRGRVASVSAQLPAPASEPSWMASSSATVVPAGPFADPSSTSSSAGTPFTASTSSALPPASGDQEPCASVRSQSQPAVHSASTVASGSERQIAQAVPSVTSTSPSHPLGAVHPAAPLKLPSSDVTTPEAGAAPAPQFTSVASAPGRDSPSAAAPLPTWAPSWPQSPPAAPPDTVVGPASGQAHTSSAVERPGDAQPQVSGAHASAGLPSTHLRDAPQPKPQGELRQTALAAAAASSSQSLVSQPAVPNSAPAAGLTRAATLHSPAVPRHTSAMPPHPSFPPQPRLTPASNSWQPAASNRAPAAPPFRAPLTSAGSQVASSTPLAEAVPAAATRPTPLITSTPPTTATSSPSREQPWSHAEPYASTDSSWRPTRLAAGAMRPTTGVTAANMSAAATAPSNEQRWPSARPRLFAPGSSPRFASSAATSPVRSPATSSAAALAQATAGTMASSVPQTSPVNVSPLTTSSSPGDPAGGVAAGGPAGNFQAQPHVLQAAAAGVSGQWQRTAGRAGATAAGGAVSAVMSAHVRPWVPHTSTSDAPRRVFKTSAKTPLDDRLRTAQLQKCQHYWHIKERMELQQPNPPNELHAVVALARLAHLYARGGPSPASHSTTSSSSFSSPVAMPTASAHAASSFSYSDPYSASPSDLAASALPNYASTSSSPLDPSQLHHGGGAGAPPLPPNQLAKFHDLLTTIHGVLERHVDVMRPRELCHALWAAGLLDVWLKGVCGDARPVLGEGLVRAMLAALTPQMARCNERDLCDLCLGLKALRFAAPPACTSHLLYRLGQLAPTMSARSLVVVGYNVVQIPGVMLQPDQVRQIIECVCTNIHELNVVDVVNVLVMLARTRFLPAPAAMAILTRCAARRLPRFGGREMTAMLHSLAVLRWLPAPLIMKPILQTCRALLPNISPSHLPLVAWSVSKLVKRHKVKVWVHIYVDHCFRGDAPPISEVTPAGLLILLGGLIRLKFRLPIPYHTPLLRVLHAALPHMGPREVSGTAWSLARLGVLPGPGFLRGLLEAARQPLEVMTGRQLANLLWGLQRVGALPHRQWLVAAVSAAAPHVPRMSASELSQVLWALGKYGHRPSPAWMEAWLARSMATLGELQTTGFTTVAHALKWVRYVPSEAWMAAFELQMELRAATFPMGKLIGVRSQLSKLRQERAWQAGVKRRLHRMCLSIDEHKRRAAKRARQQQQQQQRVRLTPLSAPQPSIRLPFRGEGKGLRQDADALTHVTGL